MFDRQSRVHKPWGKTPIKKVVSCRKCDWTWKPSTGFGREPCPNCGNMQDVRHRVHAPNVENLKAWTGHKGRATEAERRYRRRALLLVGRGVVACVGCGCDDARLLEINHKNGGGGKEHASLNGRGFHRQIAQMKRSVDDLDLRCRPCNAVHFLESKYGPLPFKVTWSRQSPR